MDHIGVVKTADHMDDGVYLPDIGKELIAQAFALGGALYKSGDVHELDHRMGGLSGIVHGGELVQTGIRNGNHAHIGVNGAERVVGGFRPCFCQGIK